MLYRFHKVSSEAGNIDGCQFTMNYYQTTSEETATLLRNYSGFNKTVFEIGDEPAKKPATQPDYNKWAYEKLYERAKELGLTSKMLKKSELVALLKKS